MTGLRAVAHQMRFDALAQLRNPPVVFFGLALPVIFLLIFATIFGNQTVDLPGGTIRTSTYYVPGIVALGIVSTTFVNLAIGLTFQRESGLLKRLRGTPLPLGTFIVGRVGVQVGLALLLTVVLVAVGRVAYGVNVSLAAVPAIVLVLLVGAACFAALGIALTAIIPNEDAAPAITNLIALPLYFISGIFIPTDQAPALLNDVAAVFPLSHLFQALLAAFDPAAVGTSIEWGDLGVLGLWGAAGALIALRSFRWTPRGG
jgi:ABC-2 type transport system permease protein